MLVGPLLLCLKLNRIWGIIWSLLMKRKVDFPLRIKWPREFTDLQILGSNLKMKKQSKKIGTSGLSKIPQEKLCFYLRKKLFLSFTKCMNKGKYMIKSILFLNSLELSCKLQTILQNKAEDWKKSIVIIIIFSKAVS